MVLNRIPQMAPERVNIRVFPAFLQDTPADFCSAERSTPGTPVDLRNLFEVVCAEFFVPITNFKGWSDLNSRAAMMARFAEHEAAGRRCVLLLCGDHDPGGLRITSTMRKNLNDLSGTVGWDPGKSGHSFDLVSTPISSIGMG